MIQIKNTPNLTGVEISGDFQDFESLVDAFYQITVDETSQKNQAYINISTRVLGLCYEVRHAMQGERGIGLVENGINEAVMKTHVMVVPKNNIYYKCNYIYPEMFFVMLALNELVKMRMRELIKAKYASENALEHEAIWDVSNQVQRMFSKNSNRKYL